ncbi:hypothetical protein AVEN_128104-1 [Araneus ventricosus]|uniref:Uncharacterized protein n=1 Tax=Araneus ventricosus TaxID=182803 RepID=A0A4Y2A039_ARAVE|nr:hypothetical protein AVEN_128104-1 [Araneus ventricosus]
MRGCEHLEPFQSSKLWTVSMFPRINLLQLPSSPSRSLRRQRCLPESATAQVDSTQKSRGWKRKARSQNPEHSSTESCPSTMPYLKLIPIYK